MTTQRLRLSALGGQQGYILLPVMFAVVLVAAIALMMNHETVSNIALLENNLDGTRAEYVAQAGLQHGLWRAQAQGCGPFTDLASQPLGDDSYSTTLTTGLGATNTLTASVDQDAWIRSDQPATNNGGDSKLHIRQEGGAVERPLYRYDLSGIAVGTGIVSATAWFYVTKEHPEGAVTIHRVTADWTEGDATWDSVGTEMDATVLATIPAQSAADIWVAVNLTTQVQTWVNGESNFGIMLHTDAEGVHGDYASQENTQVPYLEIVTGTPAAATATLSAIGTLADGTSRTLTRSGAVLSQAPAGHRQWQPDAAAGKDAWLNQASPDNNYGVSTELRVQDTGSGSGDHALVQLALAGVPPGAEIVDATLDLYQYDTGTAGGTVGVHRVTTSWTEGSNDGASGSGASWNDRTSSNSWSLAGGDYERTAVDVRTIAANTAASYRWDITSLVQGWVDGSIANNGVILVAASAGTEAGFRSSDHAAAAERPKLTLTFRCACGEPCVAPQGATGKIAMIVDYQSLKLRPADALKKAIIESWGFSVDAHDDNFLWLLNPDDYLALYVSQTAGTAAIGSQLTDVTIGIVNELGDNNAELGIAPGAAWPIGKGIEVTDNGHYITQPFATGSLPIYDASMEGQTVSGGTSVDAQLLADWGGSAALVALDAGATLAGGGTAAGRRVMVPFGRTTDWSRVNGNGRLLLYRALTWATDVDAAPTPVCGDYTPIRKKSEFATGGYGSTTIKGLTYLPADRVFNGITAPADGAWLSVDSGSDKIYMTDMLGNALTSVDTPGTAPTGIAYVESGSHADQLLVTDYFSGLFRLDMDGNQLGNPAVPDVTYPVGVGYIGGTASGTYDDAIAVLDVSGVVSVVDQSWNQLVMHDLSASLNQAEDLAHIRGTDGLLIVDQGADKVFRAGLDGSAAELYSTADYGSTVAYAIAINTDTCEQVLGDIGIDKVISLTDQPRVPIAHWKLDDASETVAVDSVGGHDGTLVNGPTWTTGQVDGALGFDGSNDHVLVPHDDGLSLSGNFTLSAWINTTKVDSSYQTILSKGTVALEENYWLGLWDDRFEFGFHDGFQYRTFVPTTFGLVADTWYHVALTFDASSGQILWYLNGTVVDTVSTGYRPAANNESLMIGTSALGEAWSGSLDDVRIYDEVMSQAEVAALIEEGGGSMTPPPSPPPGSCSGTYRDEFNANSYTGDDGTLSWSGDWQEINESDGPQRGDEVVQPDPLASPAGLTNQLRVRDNDGGGEGVMRALDLSGAATATLTLEYRRYALDDSSDYVVVEMSTNGTAGPWTEVARFAGPGGETAYQPFSVDVSAFASASAAIRFVSSSTLGRSDDVWFDNIQIECGP